ncbi:hypothetical protein FHG87_002758 [Trinorchestia longiramus]|nr:hypothetical protein FHG87_002758 [Trinorchestia longiramus]
MYRVLKEDLGMYPYKMMKRHELTEQHEGMRAERSLHILNKITQGTLPNLVFPDEKKFDIHLQQDSAPSHDFNVPQTWFQRNIPSSISKNVWPARSPDLNPLDFSIWSILETRVLATPHTSLESFKAKLQRELEAILQEQICAACDTFVNRLEAAMRNKGDYIE